MRALSGDMPAREVIALLGLVPHREGGHYIETFRDPRGPDPAQTGERGHSTAIYYLLQVGECSHWHKVDACEHWFWHAGGPLALSISLDGQTARALHLGPDLRAGQRPQATVPEGAWQAAESLGSWTLVSCVVAPGFEFAGFELAPPDWFPGKS